MSSTDFFASGGALRRLAILCAWALPQLWAGAAHADEATQMMDVSLQILPSCTLQTPTITLDFGNQRVVGGAPITRQIEVTSTEQQVTCSQGYTWNSRIDRGQNAVGDQLRMFNPATNSYVPYTLLIGYVGNPFRQFAKYPLNGTGTGDVQRVIYYGQILQGTQLGPAGRYSDQLIVTFSF